MRECFSSQISYNDGHFFCPGGQPIHLATATRACPQVAKQPLENGQFFQRLVKKSRMVMKSHPFSSRMINRSTIVI